MEYGLIGEKLPHSFSKEIHAQLGSYDYRICEIAPDELDGFMKKRDFKGINVTIPYKQAVIPYLDSISDEAKAIGAVNTVVNKEGKLYGYNTDFAGLKGLICRSKMDISGKKVLILGSGGTSKTAYAVAKALGASEILKVSRSPKENEISYDDAYSLHSDAKVLINTTPVGMFPKNDSCPIDISKLENLLYVVDAIYNPLRTRFVLRAEEKGIRATGGLYMLLYQAAKAAELFLDEAISEEKCERAYLNINDMKENIVLTGMPSCGKSTVGKILSEKLKMEFYDSDDIIEEQINMTIAEYFEKYGEQSFRDVESQVISSLSQKTGCIISTGGGAILRRENVLNLKGNGKIYFIDRPLDMLLATKSRPLSSDREALEKRFNERYNIYVGTADVQIKSETTAEDAADKIIKDRRK